MVTYFTTEGVFGITTRGTTAFADPPCRKVLMESVFGSAVVASQVFGSNELPHGATISGDRVYFVVHAPHAVFATLILVTAAAPGEAVRRGLPMSLTNDTLYWWCAVQLASAPAGTRYHFVLNDDLEVMDSAAREVLGQGEFRRRLRLRPNDEEPPGRWSSTSTGCEAPRVRRRGNRWDGRTCWSTRCTQRRSTDDLSPGVTGPLSNPLVDELEPTSPRLGQSGTFGFTRHGLRALAGPRFNFAVDWGYDPAFYFAVDGHYGGSAGLARFVNAAHANNRAVILDVVYNHSLGSPLMKIAPDVYTNGNYDGDRMNCGHPMVVEHLRQATIHLADVRGGRFPVRRHQHGRRPNARRLGVPGRSTRRFARRRPQRPPRALCVAENSATIAWTSQTRRGVMDAVGDHERTASSTRATTSGRPDRRWGPAHGDEQPRLLGPPVLPGGPVR